MTSPTSPATIARADERRHTTLDAELDEPRATPCSADWHEKCDGFAYIPARDAEIPCLCDCGHVCGRGAA